MAGALLATLLTLALPLASTSLSCYQCIREVPKGPGISTFYSEDEDDPLPSSCLLTPSSCPEQDATSCYTVTVLDVYAGDSYQVARTEFYGCVYPGDDNMCEFHGFETCESTETCAEETCNAPPTLSCNTCELAADLFCSASSTCASTPCDPDVRHCATQLETTSVKGSCQVTRGCGEAGKDTCDDTNCEICTESSCVPANKSLLCPEQCIPLTCPFCTLQDLGEDLAGCQEREVCEEGVTQCQVLVKKCLNEPCENGQACSVHVGCMEEGNEGEVAFNDESELGSVLEKAKVLIEGSNECGQPSTLILHVQDSFLISDCIDLECDPEISDCKAVIFECKEPCSVSWGKCGPEIGCSEVKQVADFLFWTVVNITESGKTVATERPNASMRYVCGANSVHVSVVVFLASLLKLFLDI